MGLYPVRVARTAVLGPNLRRVTLAGELLDRFPFAGPDQRVKLLLPLPGQQRPHVEGVAGPRDVLDMPAEIRPVMRTYTIRGHRPDAGEVDIDFALHGGAADSGPASAWAMTARPGDHAALYGPAASYEPAADASWQLLAGDESALPAIGAILDHRPDALASTVFVELADPRDAQPLRTGDGVEVRWLDRGGRRAKDSTLLLEAVRGLALPVEPGYVWLAGESSVVTTLRRHLVNETGLDRERVTFTGYWRHGRSENDN